MNRTREVAIVGDVHGNLRALEGILAILQPLSQDATLVFVGDYVNRGPDSSGVLDRLVELQDDLPRCVFISGNHDSEFLKAIDSGSVTRLLRMGGAPTIRSYVGEPEGDIGAELSRVVPRQHVKFLRSMVPVWSNDEVVVTHAPADPVGTTSGHPRLHVFGHVPTSSRIPVIRLAANTAAIDTGCGIAPDGRLTVLYLPSLEYAQVDTYGLPVPSSEGSVLND